MTRSPARYVLLLLFAAACDHFPRHEDGESRGRGPVDSVVPREVALARLREGLARPARLTGGARSQDALVRRFVRALEARDTAALARMAITRAEFAFLYYPTTPQSRPPYDLSPALLWFTLEGRSRQDLATAIDLLGGRPLQFVDHRCQEPIEEGNNRVHRSCLVRHRTTAGDTAEGRWFGSILERDGEFKFLSYANKL